MAEKFMQHYVNGAGLRRLRAHKNAEAVRQDTLELQRRALAEADARHAFEDTDEQRQGAVWVKYSRRTPCRRS